MDGIVAVIVPSSGAAVIIFMRGGRRTPEGERVGFRFVAPYISSRVLMPSTQGTMFSTLWMPFLVGERKGPSQWAPRDSAPSSAMRRPPEGPRKGSACAYSTYCV